MKKQSDAELADWKKFPIKDTLKFPWENQPQQWITMDELIQREQTREKGATK